MAADRPVIAVSGVFLGQPLTGVQRYAGELLGAMAAVGAGRLRFVAIAPEGRSGRALRPAPPGVEIALDRSRLPALLWTQARLPALARREGARLLWSPANTGPLGMKNQVVTIFDASFLARPEGFSRAFRLYYRFLVPRLARRCARVVTISEFSRSELVRFRIAPAERIDVVPCGVSGAFHPAADPGPWAVKAPYLLAVGARDPRKNVATLFRAWPLVRRGFPRHRLLVAGGGERIFGSGLPGELPDGVELLGAVPDATLPGLYAAADALVYPTLYEGFGLPPLEAMACGTPVLASRAASLPEACGDAALYCDPLDASGMARELERLLGDGQLRARLREAGRRRAAEFTWQRAAKRMLGVLDNAIEAC